VQVKSLTSIGDDYQADLAETKAGLGTIDQDILSRERGARQAGISSAYQESRKGLEADLARRGLTGSGAGVGALQQNYALEAQQKAQSNAQARMQSLGLSVDNSFKQVKVQHRLYMDNKLV